MDYWLGANDEIRLLLSLSPEFLYFKKTLKGECANTSEEI